MVKTLLAKCHIGTPIPIRDIPTPDPGHLASRYDPWHSAAMTGDPPPPHSDTHINPHVDRARISGGFPIAMCTIVGTLAGGFRHQMSIGMLAGFSVGVVIAIGLWLWDRKR